MAAATAVSAAGQLQSGLYASKVAGYQAQVAQRNKGLVREGAIDAIGQGQEDQRRLGREVAERVGSQIARVSANNVDPTYGSAARLVGDTQMIGQEDSMTLAENVRRRVRGMQIEGWSLESERLAALAEKKQAKIGTAFGVASTVLGGATQYAKFKAGR